VYDLYAEDLQEFYSDLEHARDQLVQKHVSRSLWPAEIASLPPTSGDGQDLRDTAADRADRDVEITIEGLDPSMKAFLALERRLKKNSSSAAQTGQGGGAPP
jgi:aarF domain-containing kinase